MKHKTRRKILTLISLMLLIANLAVACGFICLKAEARTYPGITMEQVSKDRPFDGIVGDENGFMYVYKKGKLQTGYFRFEGHWYYGHKTSGSYPKGSVTMGQMRIRNGNRWYAYDTDGKQICNDVYIHKGRFRKVKQLQLAKDNRVLYVYETAAISRGERYSTRDRRWQQECTAGHWYTPEQMQTIPGDWVDFQR